jgi:hypothetical protein
MVPGTPFTPREDMRILPTGVCLAVGANFYIHRYGETIKLEGEF